MSRIRFSASSAGILTCAIGTVALLGWTLDLEMLKSVVPGFVSMKFNTALCFGMAGMALLLIRTGKPAFPALLAARCCAVAVAVIGGMNLVEDLGRIDFGIDQALFQDILPPGSRAAPGRMAPLTALSFIFTGTVLLLADSPDLKQRIRGQWLALLVMLFGMLGVIGYLYGVDSFHTLGHYTGMALHTALAFMVLAGGLLLLNSSIGIVAITTGSQPGALMIRKLTPMVVGTAVILGGLTQWGKQIDLFDDRMAAALLITALILIISGLIWLTAEALNRADYQRRRTEEELRDKEQQLRTVTDNAPVYIAQCDRDRRYRFVNKPYADRFGRTVSDLIGRHPREIMGEETYAQASPHMEAVLRGERPEYVLTLPVTPEGPRVVRVAYSPESDADGAVVGFVAAIIDITERTRTTESLLIATERLDLAQRVARFGVWDWDIVSNSTVWSEEMFHLFGLDPGISSASVEVWQGILHPDDRVAAGQAIEAALREHTMLDSDYRIVTPDQQVRWINATGKATYDDSGRPVRMIGICADITERRQAEEVLRTREQQFQMMFENHDAVMLLINPETGAIIDANGAAARFYGYDFATLISKNINDINALDPNEIKTVCSRALHGERNTFIFPHRIAGGETRMVEVNASPITHKGQTILFSIIHDITDRIRAEEQLRKTLAELSRSNEELQQFAYVASHDLREPLRMVVSYTELLAKRYGNQLDDAANKFIAYAVEGATRLQRLIDDLLAFSRVGTKRQPQESAPTGELLDAAVHNLQAAIEESGAVITHDALPTVRADHSQLIQLFQNLVGNAIKFRRPGAPPHIHVTACNLGQEWQFSVADNGIGIDPQFNERIFVIFQRLHAREQYPGTGIGLAICKRIVERHGGRIWVESTPGEGTTFHFTLG